MHLQIGLEPIAWDSNSRIYRTAKNKILVFAMLFVQLSSDDNTNFLMNDIWQMVKNITKNVKNLRSAFSVLKPLRSTIVSICSFPVGSLLNAFSIKKTQSLSSSAGSSACNIIIYPYCHRQFSKGYEELVTCEIYPQTNR